MAYGSQDNIPGRVNSVHQGMQRVVGLGELPIDLHCCEWEVRTKMENLR